MDLRIYTLDIQTYIAVVTIIPNKWYQGFHYKRNTNIIVTDEIDHLINDRFASNFWGSKLSDYGATDFTFSHKVLLDYDSYHEYFSVAKWSQVD